MSGGQTTHRGQLTTGVGLPSWLGKCNQSLSCCALQLIWFSCWQVKSQNQRKKLKSSLNHDSTNNYRRTKWLKWDFAWFHAFSTGAVALDDAPPHLAQLGLHHDIHDIFLQVIQLDGQKHCLFWNRLWVKLSNTACEKCNPPSQKCTSVFSETLGPLDGVGGMLGQPLHFVQDLFSVVGRLREARRGRGRKAWTEWIVRALPGYLCLLDSWRWSKASRDVSLR